MNFQRDFDTLLDQMLTDWQNQSEDGRRPSKGDLIFMKIACLASASWGIYKYQDWIARQIFPDTAATAYLEHHAWIRNIPRNVGETDPELLARVLDDIRRPPAGGNKYDYVKWALSVSGIAKAYCIPLAQGLGTVDVIVLANSTATGSEIPSSSARIGVVTSIAENKLNDSGAAFSTAHAVAVGDIVENPLRETRTTVSLVDSATQVTLAADIFKFAGEPYIIHCQTGSNTGISTGKLVDSAGAFTDADYTVQPGDIVENLTDNLRTTIESVDSATQVTLAADIFQAAGKAYVIRGLIAQVKSYVDLKRPATASKVSILPPTIVTQAVTMTVTGMGLDCSAVAASVSVYLNTLTPGQTLYLAKLMQIAMDAGADNVVIATPAADVTATIYQMIRPGVINVS